MAEATETLSNPPKFVHGTDHRGTEHQELGILVGGVTGTKRLPNCALPIEKLTCLPEPLTPANGFCGTGTPMPCFLAMLRNVVISSCWWSAAMLAARTSARSRTGLARPHWWRSWPDAELEQLPLGVHHEGQHPVGNGAEVMVVEFLALGRLRTEQRTAGVDQVRTSQEEVPVDQEVLLLRPAERHDVVEILVSEQLQDSLSLCTHRLLATQQRGLEVECLTGHRHEDRGDAQGVAVRVLQNVGRAGDVPPVYPRASNVLRRPPDGKLDASGSP